MPIEEKTVDPVCGMTIDRNQTYAALNHEGHIYHFCSACCERRFQEEPGKYADHNGGVLAAGGEDGGDRA